MAFDDSDAATALDYLGRKQRMTPPRISLTTSAGGGPVTAPVTPATRFAQGFAQRSGLAPSRPAGPDLVPSSRAGQESLDGPDLAPSSFDGPDLAPSSFEGPDLAPSSAGALGAPRPAASGPGQTRAGRGAVGATPRGVQARSGSSDASLLAQQILGLGSQAAGLAGRLTEGGAPAPPSDAAALLTPAGALSPAGLDTAAREGTAAGIPVDIPGVGNFDTPTTLPPVDIPGVGNFDTPTTLPPPDAGGVGFGDLAAGAGVASGALALARGLQSGQPIAAVRGGISLASSGARALGIELGALGQAAPYVGAALNIVQNALAGNMPADQQAVNAAIETIGAVLAPETFGLSAIAAPILESLLSELWGSSGAWRRFSGEVGQAMHTTFEHLEDALHAVSAATSPQDLAAIIDAYNQSQAFPGSTGRPAQVAGYTVTDVSSRDWPGGEIHGQNFPSTDEGFARGAQALNAVIALRQQGFASLPDGGQGGGMSNGAASIGARSRDAAIAARQAEAEQLSRAQALSLELAEREPPGGSA